MRSGDCEAITLSLSKSLIYMSKIGKKPITIPKDVQIKMDNGLVLVKGPKGELKRFIPGNVDLNIEGDVLRVIPKNRSALVLDYPGRNLSPRFLSLPSARLWVAR